MCSHPSTCPPPTADGRVLAVPLHRRPEQGWTLLCNGVVVFDDDGELLPDGQVVLTRPWALAGASAG
ncbi:MULTISPECIES: DUF5999 family protein [Modestobacter]|jgi:hypothetical protein|uniref:Uncharacterized protein n=1 Tax=Modestobacter caceresii TaxID=1522368 RepID=A0A098YDM3_9ACTN|nr:MULTISPECIES: DUF5999 family protein [Modestobacter]KGH48540.1 hypothetical protein IN07_00800 [Modestobacter caceresii]